MILFDILDSIHSGKHIDFPILHSRMIIFVCSCEVCRKGFLHQNQLYAHHKQRHANETIQSFMIDQPEQKQEFDEDHIDYFLDTQ